MTSLLPVVAPLQGGSSRPPSPKHTEAVGIAVLQWGKGGEFGQEQEPANARTGGSSGLIIATPHDPKKPKEAEHYTFTEVSRTVEVASYETQNGVVVKFPKITSIVFEGPKRVRGGLKKKGKGSGEHDKQLYRFHFNADCWHRIVAIRVHGTP